MHLRRFLTAVCARGPAAETLTRVSLEERQTQPADYKLARGIKLADAPLINSGRSFVLSSAGRGADRPGSQRECDKREKLPTLVMHREEFMAREASGPLATLSIRVASFEGSKPAAAGLQPFIVRHRVST